jgi:hypothetical protein
MLKFKLLTPFQGLNILYDIIPRGDCPGLICCSLSENLFIEVSEDFLFFV